MQLLRFSPLDIPFDVWFVSTLTSKLEFKSKMIKAEYELIHSFNEWDRIWPAELQSEIYEFIDFQSGVQVQTPRFCVPNPTPHPRSARSTTFSFTQDLLKRKKRRSHGVKPGIAETATLSWFQKEIIVSKRMMLHESYHDAKKIQVLKNMSFKQKEDKDIMNDSWHLTRFVGWGYIQGTISSFRFFSCKKKIEDPFSRTCSNFCVPKIGSQKLKNLKKDCEFQHVFSTTNPCSNLLVRVP